MGPFFYSVDCIKRDGWVLRPKRPPTEVAHGGKTMRLQWSKATKEDDMRQRRSCEPVRLPYTAAFPGRGTYLAFDEVWGATICPDCFTCRGELEVRGPVPASDDRTERRPKEVRRFHQCCRCEGSSKEERWVAWPGTNVRFDFNCYLELCHCCGIEPIRSGSRCRPSSARTARPARSTSTAPWVVG